MPHFLIQSNCCTAGASVEVLARAASEDAAWLAFQRMSAWWLGEHANVAANEFAGTSGIEADTFEDEGVIKPPSGRVEIATHNKPLSAGEVCCLLGGASTAARFIHDPSCDSACHCSKPSATCHRSLFMPHLKLPAGDRAASQREPCNDGSGVTAAARRVDHALGGPHRSCSGHCQGEVVHPDCQMGVMAAPPTPHTMS
jgi:hypothetical protein